jgi:hypothetical protein
MTYRGQEPAHDVSTSTETPLQGEVGSQDDRTSETPTEARTDACDGSDDPRLRCGLHHATGLAQGGGYACCCGLYWTSKNTCESGASAGQPVGLQQRIYEVLAYTVADTPHDIDKHANAVMELLGGAMAALAAPDCEREGITP